MSVLELFYYVKIITISVSLIALIWSFFEKEKYRLKEYNFLEKLKIVFFLKKAAKDEDKSRVRRFRISFYLIIGGWLLFGLAQFLEKYYMTNFVLK